MKTAKKYEVKRIIERRVHSFSTQGYNGRGDLRSKNTNK